MNISNRIRKQLEQPNGLTPELMRPLADDYARLVSDANMRLDECISMLRRGLRSEALQLAATKPHILDVVAELDFPELPDWIEILQFYGIDLPESIDRDAVSHLNEALVESQPLEELLCQHRRMAIAKAPLAWRIGVLRKIATIDSLNPVWTEDLRDWESMRIKQIAQLWKVVNKIEFPLEDLELLRDEVFSTSWIVKPDSELVEDIDRVTKQRLDQSIFQELKSLANEIHDAFVARDEIKLNSLALAWEECIQKLHAEPPIDLVNDVEPALEWRRDRKNQAERQESLSSLTNQIEALLQNKKATEKEIHNIYSEIDRYGSELDSSLVLRYETKIHDLLRSKRNKRISLVVGAIATCIVVVCCAAVWYRESHYHKTISDVLPKLTELIDKERFTEAESVLLTIEADSPRVSKSNSVSVLKSKLESRIADEQRRSNRVAELIDAADTGEDELLNIEKILSAEKAAKTDEEKMRISKIRDRFERHQEKRIEQEEVMVKQELRQVAIELEIRRKESLSSINEDELVNTVARLQDLFLRFPLGSSRMGEEIKEATDSVKYLLESVRKTLREMADKDLILSRIREAANLKEYEIHLRKFVNTLPNDSLSDAFKRSSEESELWWSVEEWNQWCNDVILQITGKLERTKSDSMLSRCDDLIRRIDGLPGGQVVLLYRNRYEPVMKRGELLNSLIENIKNSVILELVTVENIARRIRVFIKADSVKDLGTVIAKTKSSTITTLPVLRDSFGAVANQEFRGKLQLTMEPRQSVRILIRDLESSRERILVNWEQEWFLIIENLISDSKVDGRIKELLLARFSVVAQDGSTAIMKAFEGLQTELFNTSEVRNRWYEESPVSDAIGVNLRSELERAKDSLQNILADELNALKEISKFRVVWIGSLLVDENGAFEAVLNRDDIPDGTIVMATSDRDRSGAMRLVPVGNVRNKLGELKGNVDELIPGRPLFWIRMTSK